ncbi:hypothetical protein L1047_02445 [Synechococcus sp. Nb3U1]|uniref:hypothetical protein n=1 Tax=Synechococcus sp. Nb3U1 TaxID=1914529 RepID=UPI001F22C5AF|nr:hypothetical protein [Synechococcus sp. Nb3U1]MCF2970055.1 hypothetical protein [Synechococcus sp. Nb3U1]
MEKETLDSFLSIQGVMGVALLSRTGRPYFYRSFQDLDSRQQQALTQGLFQVLETMPQGFDYFDFQFAEQRVFVYPLGAEWVLLVAVNDDLVMPVYSLAVNRLRAELQRDTQKGLATFRLFTSQMEANPNTTRPTATRPSSTSTSGTSMEMDTFMRSLNRLCQMTTGYLGKAVIVNYWKAARQEVLQRQGADAELLNQFEIERSGQIRYDGPLTELDESQQRVLRDWVLAFFHRCEEVIHDFRNLIKSAELRL